MIVVTNRIYVNPEYAEPFEERFRNRASLVEEMPGFIAYQLLRPQSEDAPYLVMTTWESRQAFEAWTRSEAFQQGHGRSGTLPKEAYTAPNQLEIHEIIAVTSAE